ncbi:VanZ family protein [Anaerocolumna sp. AGMB13020]|uniref:VanZ family protein n=1 Tax=Anaerocolumna sp. AGMB13020 TaxID=3081750 RepID=UPI0029529E3B|nr:VanZ family protein [Anaerocolumna sp. AGMB13020]WOO38828.1 VanZ family protein [Anaerocolumna sp. AGMB13020]
MKKNKLWLTWIPAMLIMVMIFMFSMENGNQSSDLSGSLTKSMVEAVIDAIDLELTQVKEENIIELIHTPIRKAGHLTEYALLGIAVAFPLLRKHGLKGKHLFITGLLICTFYAATDELHQLFVPGRAGMVTDVMIDAVGAGLGILLFQGMHSLRLAFKKSQKNPIDKVE